MKLELIAVLIVGLCHCQDETNPVVETGDGTGLTITTFDKLPFCLDNTTCWGNPAVMRGKTQDNVCCGYTEYEKNGAIMQTAYRCLTSTDFVSYWEEFKKNINMENVYTGCVIPTIDGDQINDFGYGGPELSSAQVLLISGLMTILTIMSTLL